MVGVSLEWENITYTIKGKEKPILDRVSGSVGEGKLLAILGPSGAGKTSLLNALAGRLPYSKTSTLSGDLKINGRTPELDVKEISAYVMQDEALFEFSTVQETFDFRKNLSRQYFRDDKAADEAVKRVLNDLSLEKARETIIGNTTNRGISGGERKRVNIGTDLLFNPPLIFLDEPTTGLDSFQAENVMLILKQLAQQGQTIICVIHQPRSSIFGLLDEIILMSEGSCMYAGPAGDDVKHYFANLGYEVPNDFNPADHFLDIISIDQRYDQIDSTTERHQILRKAWLAHNATIKQSTGSINQLPISPTKAIKKANFAVSFYYLLRRCWIDKIRDPEFLAIKLVVPLFMGLIYGLIYFQLGHGLEDIQNRMGAIFFMAMNAAFGGTIGTAQIIPQQLAVIIREREAGLYGIFEYHLATILACIPFDTFFNIVCPFIVWWMCNLRHGVDRFFTYMALQIIENFCCISFGFMVSCMFANKPQNFPAEMAPLFIIIFIMFSGYFINEDSIPPYLAWMKYFSFVRYTYQALAVNEFKTFDGDTVYFEGTVDPSDYIPSTTTTTGAPFSGPTIPIPSEYDVKLTGDSVLDLYNLSDVDIVDNIIFLWIFIAVTNILAAFFLWFNTPKHMKFPHQRSDPSRSLLLGNNNRIPVPLANYDALRDEDDSEV